MMSLQEKKQCLLETYQGYKSNPLLDHLRANAKNFVGGIGPLNASVMLVGEAPGEHEDAAGRPFVGPSGQILDTLIKRSGMKRDELFITNVVKYRTMNAQGQNRHPTKQEVQDSFHCLKTEIVYVDPKVIALMGNTAIKAFFPLHNSYDGHGIIFKLTPESRPVVFLFHPGVAIYSKEMMGTLIQDFKRINEALASKE
jgi:uracil-DNA glycosylase